MRFALSAFWLMTVSPTLWAQAVPRRIMTPPPPRQANASRAEVEKLRQQLNDWPNLARYRDENTKLQATPSPADRVVFMGDSITDMWGRERGSFFPGKPYVNRGISGQTTPQMLLRFRTDVIALKPRVVVIHAGTNDIAGNTGPETLPEIEGYLASMAELARANSIHVVLASVTPVSDTYRRQTDRRPPETIVALNAWIKEYCVRNHLVFLDYYTATVDDKEMFRNQLTYDGLHPTSQGYEVMGPLAEKAIADAFAKADPY